jgi:hypothetical protein
MDTITKARTAACASQVLQQRIESLRIANWHQVTDANWLQTNLLNTNAPGATFLKNVSETVTLAPYGSATIGNIQLTRTNGTASIAANTPLLTESAVKVIWAVTYAGANNQTTSRQMVAILAKGGVARW